MSATFLPILPLWVINLTLVVLVYIRAPFKASHQAFTAFVLSVVLWSFCLKMVDVYSAGSGGIFWGRLIFTTASLVGMSLVVFCQTFPDLDRFEWGRGLRLFLLLGAVIMCSTFTPLIMIDVNVTAAGHLQPRYGPLHPLFGIFILTSVLYGIWSLAKKWWVARGRKKLQMQYLWLGLGFFLVGATTTNLIIPDLTHNSYLSAYGPYFTLCFIGMTAHAIIRHRLMDIRLVVRQSVTYGLSVGITVGIMWSVLTAIGRAISLQGHYVLSTLALCVGVGSIVVFYPLRQTLQRLLDKYCYRTGYDDRQATRMMSQELLGLMRLAPLYDYLTSFLLTMLKVESTAIYLCGDQGVLECCVFQHAHGDQAVPETTAAPEAIEIMARVGVPLVFDELGLWPNRRETFHLSAVFVALRCEVIVPLLVETRVVAILSISEKLSGDPFFQHDVELLTTVEHQASVALRRAQLYEEAAWMQEYNASILRQMKSGVVAINTDGMITMMNEAAADLLMMTTDAAVNHPVADVLDTELSAPLLSTLTGNVIFTDHETSVLLASGRALQVMLSTSVFQRPEVGLAGTILVFHDLSRVKEFEAEKRRIERLASVGAFAGKIAHEIKNPLVAIKTLAELLPEQYDDEEFRTTFAQVALQEVKRIDDLVQRLRSVRAVMPARTQQMSIIAPLDETLVLLSGEFRKQSIEVRRQYHAPLPSIMGDHDQLKQVFLNLCLNSVEAMEQGGLLQITIAAELGHDHAPSALTVQIRDTGPGIPEEYLPKIFEPFVTSKADGSGLGLAICKGIIDWHRGTIAAANCPDMSGTTFTLRLPACQREDAYEVPAPDDGCTTAARTISTPA